MTRIRLTREDGTPLLIPVDMVGPVEGICPEIPRAGDGRSRVKLRDHTWFDVLETIDEIADLLEPVPPPRHRLPGPAELGLVPGGRTP